MQLTAETFGKLQNRLDDLASQAVGPLREQVLTLSISRDLSKSGALHALNLLCS